MNCSKEHRNTTWSAAWGGTRVVALAFFCVLLLTSTADAKNRKLSRDLDAATMSSQPIDVIVQYKTSPNGKHFAKAQGHGATLKHAFGVIKAAQFSIPGDQLSSLINDDSDITYVTPDRKLSTTSFTDGFVAVGANAVRGYGYDGTGIGIAVIDSGINASHPDLANQKGNSSRVVYAQDFTGQGTTDDLYGHGTHVAGIAAGNGRQSSCSYCFQTYMGVAPNANVLNLRVLDSNGSGTDSAVINAIQTAIALKSKYNIRVINLSLGRGIYESYALDPLDQAVEQAWQAGIFVVAAAGNYGRDNSNNNNGYGTITAPGNDPYVITVGAMRTMGTQTRTDDVIASYSSKGPSMLDHVVKPDIVAPGNLVASLLAPNSKLAAQNPLALLPLSSYMFSAPLLNSSYYYTLSGTSMAAPVVSGAAALMSQLNPAFTPDQIKAAMMKNAFKNIPMYSSATDLTTGVTYNEQSDIFTVGAGYLDVYASMYDEYYNSGSYAAVGLGGARSPIAYYDATSGQTTLVTDYSVLWGTSVIWGNSVLWGNSVVWGNSVLWGTSTTGQSVLWGNSVIWGSSTMDGFSVLWGTSTSPLSVLWGNSNAGSDATSAAIAGDN